LELERLLLGEGKQRNISSRRPGVLDRGGPRKKPAGAPSTPRTEADRTSMLPSHMGCCFLSSGHVERIFIWRSLVVYLAQAGGVSGSARAAGAQR
jgi:hypothetical protein